MTTTAERVRFLIGLIASAILCCFLIIVKTEVGASAVPEDILPQRTAAPTEETTANTPGAEKAETSGKTEKAEIAEPKIAFSGTVRKPSSVLPGAEPFEQAVPEAKTEPKDEAPKPEELQYLDLFTATAYCTTGLTSTGTYTTAGRTLAVNPYMIPYGTHVWLFTEDGGFVGDFYAEDTGSNMLAHPYVIDIYFGEGTYDECMEWGAQRVLVYTEPEE